MNPVTLTSEEREALDNTLRNVGWVSWLPEALSRQVERILAARLAAQAAEHEREVAGLRDQRDDQARRYLDTVRLLQERKDAAERALADLRGRVEALADEWEAAQGRQEIQGKRWMSPHVKSIRALLASEPQP